MPETKLIETTSVGCLEFPEQEVILNFNFTYNAPLDSIFEMLEIIDVFGNKIRLLRDQTKRSQVPGKILHQLRSGEIIGHGYIQFDSPDSFSFVEDPNEASKANNIGPIKQFYHHIRSLDSGLVNYDFNLSRQGSFNECEAKFVLNTQELISTIYE